MDIEFLKFLNNGYDPRLLYGTGALGYKPDRGIMGSGRVITQTKTQTETPVYKLRTYPTYFMSLTNPPEEEKESKEEEKESKEPVKEVIEEPKEEEQIIDINTDIGVINYLYNKGDEEDRSLLKKLYGDDVVDKFQVSDDNEVERPEDIEKEIQEVKEDEDEEVAEEKILGVDDRIKMHETIIKKLKEKHQEDTSGYGYDIFKHAIDDEKEMIAALGRLKDSIVIKKNIKKATRTAEKANQYLYPSEKEVMKQEVEVEKNLLKKIRVVDADLKQYETLNPNVEFTDEEYEDYPEEIKEIIEEINDVKETFFESDGIIESIDKQKAIREELCKETKMGNEVEGSKNKDFKRVLPYLESIVVKGAHKFYDAEEKKIKLNAALKAFFAPGKPAEFGICGLDNKVAKIIYNLEHPDFEITDYIIEDSGSGLGGQFPIDNVDRANLIFSEMKYYNSITIKNALKLQLRIKKRHYNELLTLITEYFTDYLIVKLEDDEVGVNKIMKKIKDTLDILTDKDKFNKDFYKNSKGSYLGIGITMNKFNPIKIPKGYDFKDSPNTREQISIIKHNQNQKFIPKIVNRKVIGMTIKRAQDKVKDTEAKKIKRKKEYDDIDGAIKNRIFSEGQDYEYRITCAMKDAIGVYDYTNDDYVENDFILGTYRTAYAHDEREGGEQNAVLIPIEKFVLPDVENDSPPSPPPKKKKGKKKQSNEI